MPTLDDNPVWAERVEPSRSFAHLVQRADWPADERIASEQMGELIGIGKWYILSALYINAVIRGCSLGQVIRAWRAAAWAPASRRLQPLRRPDDASDNIHLLGVALVSLILGIDRLDDDLGGLGLRHVLDALGHDPHAVPDDEDPRRHAYALAGVDQYAIAR